ncbi:MAG: DUF4160 domain-containing protein [Ancalomicrobiaceae bacterium]|nr:DUF4160 domain-containing protein [Ancalomicrobiaceae bacterium]
MPVVAQIDGIRIEFYFDDHAPPHFHARYGSHIIALDIKTLGVKKGSLPVPQMNAVSRWARLRQDALLAAWYACRSGEHPGEIP